MGHTMWKIIDWAGNLIKSGFTDFNDAEDWLSEKLGDNYETDRGEYYAVPEDTCCKPHGWFNCDTMKGWHERLGALRNEIVISYYTRDGVEYACGIERYFFDIDETNGQGIDRRNVAAYFERP